MAFVVSQGQLTATSWLASVPVAPAALRLADGEFRTYAHLWRKQPQVRTVVSFLARNIAQLGVHAFRRLSDTDRERLASHPILDLFSNPQAQMSRYRLFERLVSDLAIYDRGYWVKARGEGGVAAVIPVPPWRLQPEGSSWLGVDQYRVSGERGELVLPADQVVAFHGYNPLDARTGSSPLEALESMLAEEFEATRSREQMWRNGGRMSGVLTRPADAPKWDPNVKERFRESWRAYTAGGGAAGGTPILEDGMQYAQLALDPQKAQYIEARKLTREEVAAAYHIPLPMVGILDNATFSNIKEQHQQLYQDTLGPWLTSIKEDIELQLLPDVPDNNGVYIEFNLQDKLRGSFEEQAAAASTATGRPWMTVNETRGRNNLPAIEGGDELTTPLNVTVGGLASPRDTAPDEPSTEGNLKRSPRIRVKAVGAVPERPEDLGDFDEERSAFQAALEKWTGRQADQLLAHEGAKADGVSDLLEWWDDGAEERLAALSALLVKHGYRIAQLGAWGVLDAFNPEAAGWDPDVMLPWLLAAAQTHAEQHLQAGRDAVEQAQQEPADGRGDALRAAAGVWVSAASMRAGTAGAEARGFGSHDAAGASGLRKKVWRTGGKNPRASHKAQDGETVSLDDVFSNGLRWPGDGKGEAKETANCNCRLDYATE